MSTKNKVAIVLTILVMILFGITINQLAYDLGSFNLNDLAYKAATDSNGFMNTPVGDWANKSISMGNPDEAVYYKSGICMYHRSSTIPGSGYVIKDILDFKFDGQGIKLERNGNSIGINSYTGALAKELYKAYSSTSSISSKDYSTTAKNKVTYAFLLAANNGGIQASEDFYKNQANVSIGSMTYNDIDTNYGYVASSFSGITKQSADSSITVQHENASASGYTMIGPFNVTFAGSGIDSIKINSDRKDFKDGNGGQIYYSTYYKDLNNVEEGIANGGWSNQLSNIPSGVEFYIVVSDKYEEFNKGNNLNVTIYQQSIEAYRARLVLASNPKVHGQNIGFFAAESQNYTGEQTFYITKKEPVSLTVVKSGKNGNKLAIVHFFLTNDAGAFAHWGSKEDQNGVTVYSNITFKDWADDETRVFTTGTSGKFIVKDIDASYTYALQETYNANSGYSVIDIKNATLSNGNPVNIESTDSNNKIRNVVRNIKLTTQNDTLEVIDREDEEPEDFNINIKKVRLGTSSAVQNAIFKIKVRGHGWLAKNNSGYDYDADFEDAEEWKIPKSGTISIQGLNADYKYEIYETYSPYTLSKQPGHATVTIGKNKTNLTNDDYYSVDGSNNKKVLYCGVVSYKNDGSYITVTVTNYSPGGGRRRRRKQL